MAASLTESAPLLKCEMDPGSWFAVYTRSRHEKRVAQHLRERGREIFLPLIEKTHHWSKRATARLQLPLFHNYVFVRITLAQRIAVLQVPGVLGIVSRGHIPCPLPDAEIEMLQSSLQLGKVEPHPYLATGERIRIRTGPMAGMEGILLRIKNELRLVVSLELIQRSVALEIDACDVEPAVARAT